ncbi:hypothetical protein [Nocardia sp. NPDC051981]|uniref:hypothetical protein n=1 Tax=Nocardia sp. NPDC051981 TaxID=3155417 RepID=UPI0034162C2C
MTDKPRPRRSRARRNDSPELLERLQRSHQRSLERRAAATEREKAITRAVGDYLSAWNAIVGVEHRRDREESELRQQIDAVNARAASEITAHEQAQAAAAGVVRAYVHTDEELAELLEITVKRARQLVASSRAAITELSPVADNPHTPEPARLRARNTSAPRNLPMDRESGAAAQRRSASDGPKSSDAPPAEEDVPQPGVTAWHSGHFG